MTRTWDKKSLASNYETVALLNAISKAEGDLKGYSEQVKGAKLSPEALEYFQYMEEQTVEAINIMRDRMKGPI